MPIFRLTPVDPSDRDWEASTHKDECLVHAKSEKEARNYAKLAFSKATKKVPGEEIKATPWGQAAKVVVEEIDPSPEEYSDGRVDVPYMKVNGNSEFGRLYQLNKHGRTNEPSQNRDITEFTTGEYLSHCQICKTATEDIPPETGDFIHQSCPRCGEYKLAGTAVSMLKARSTPEFIAKLSGWVRDHQRSPDIPMINSYTIEEVESAKSLTFTQKIQRLLMEAAHGQKKIGDTFNFNQPRFISATHSQDKNEVNVITKAVVDQGWMNYVAMGGKTEITSEGHIEIERLEAETLKSNTDTPTTKLTKNTTIDKIISSDIEDLTTSEANFSDDFSDDFYKGLPKNSVNTINASEFFKDLNIPITESLRDLLTIAAVYTRAKKTNKEDISSTCFMFVVADVWHDRIDHPTDIEILTIDSVHVRIRAPDLKAYNYKKRSYFNNRENLNNQGIENIVFYDDGLVDFDTVDFSGMRISPGLKESLIGSSQMAKEIFEDRTVSIAHLLLTMFLNPSNFLEENLDELNLVPTNIGHDLAKILAKEDLINQNSWHDFEKKALLFKPRDYDEKFIPEIGRAGALSDTIHDSVDKLKFTAQANTFAKLITDESLRLPLAIGLFGNWGSGKSFFMNLIQSNIQEITKTARTSNPGSSTYLSRIAQIEFNAWHYMDTNLWASLAARVYEGLMEELAGPGKSITEDVRARLQSDIRSNQLQFEKADAERRIAKEKQTEAQEALETEKIKKSNAKSELDIKLFQHFKTTEGRTELLNELENITEKFTLRNTVKSAQDLNTLYAEFKELSTGVNAIGARLKFIFESSSSLIFFLLTLMITLIAIFNFTDLITWLLKDIFGWLKLVEWVSNRFTAFAAESFVTISVAVTWCGTQLNNASTGLAKVKKLWSGFDKLLKSNGDENDSIKTARKNLKDAKADFINAEERIKETEIRLKEVTLELQRINSGGLVYDFLADKLNNSEYTKNLGLISTIREDFKSLGKLMDEWRISDAIQKLDNKDNKHSIKRIVLYIDDLDRCHPDKVVEVLQAVHLLLAYDLFVVVVAVDARWLEQSLYREYMPELFAGTNNNFRMGQLTNTDEFNPHNYLEKIFQIPFSIPKMGAENFVELMIDLSGEIAPSQRNQDQDQDQDQDQFPTDKPIKEKNTIIASEHQKNIAETSSYQSSSDPQQKLHSVLRPIPPTSIPALNPEEAKCLGCMHALIKTPRQAKRLINLYRLIRIHNLETKPNSTLTIDRRDIIAASLMVSISISYPSISQIILSIIKNNINKPVLFESASRPLFGEILADLFVLHNFDQDSHLDKENTNIQLLLNYKDTDILKQFLEDLQNTSQLLKKEYLDPSSIPLEVFNNWLSSVESFSFNWSSN